MAKRRSLTQRVLFGNLVVYSLTTLGVFLLLNHLLTAHLVRQMDQSLQTELLGLTTALGRQDADQVMLHFGLQRGAAKAFCRLLDQEGATLASSPLDDWPLLLQKAPPLDPSILFHYQDYVGPAHPLGVRLLTTPLDDGRLLQIGFDRSEQKHMQRDLRHALLVILIAGLLTASLLSYAATRRGLVQVHRITEAAEGITQQLDFRHKVQDPSDVYEMAQLSRAFNQMIDRIQGLVRGQQEMMDNIAHDIRSPVARMRAEAERRLTAGQEEMNGKIIEQCDLILNLINGLLEISAVEAQTAPLRYQAVDMSSLVEDALELFEPVLEDGQRALVREVSPNCLLNADGRIMQRMVANLIDNAVKYTRSGDTIHVQLSCDGRNLNLKIADSGPGIAPEALGKIFERFYRAEAGRSKPGNGLGLAFCHAAVTAVGGRIECHSKPGEGAAFLITLPAASPA